MLDNTFKKNTTPAHGDNDNGVTNGHGGNGASKPLPIKGALPPADTENVDIFRLLDELEELPEKAKHLPLRTLIGFDQDQFYYLVLKIRANLPDDMKKAQRVARDSERIVDEARDVATQQLESGRMEAGRIQEEARAEAKQVTDRAQAQSQKIIQEARQQAEKMLEEAQKESARLIDKTEVHQMATAQAREIIQHAEVEATDIRKGADAYARDVLATIEGQMTKALTTIQHGRTLLEEARS